MFCFFEGTSRAEAPRPGRKRGIQDTHNQVPVAPHPHGDRPCSRSATIQPKLISFGLVTPIKD